MLLELILFMFLGIFAGTITGLIPGIHTNLIGIILVALSATYLSSMNSIFLIVFIVSMAITHTFVDFIPSVFLGCPDTDTELSVLPGHELLKNGKGYEAVLLTCYGSLAAVIILLLISFPSIKLLSITYGFLEKFIPYILIFISISLILLENKKLNALLVFALTGFLGWSISNFQTLEQPLLPLLTGLFGSSMLITSIKNKIKIPKQEITKPKTKLFKPLLGSLIASPLCSFLPGLGSGQAAVIGNTLIRQKEDQKGFLVLYGATNTLVMGFSFISLYVLSKTRTGTSLAIKEIIGIPSPNVLTLIILVVLFSGIISFFLTKSLTKFASQKITSINYTKISLITLTILASIVFAVSKLTGLIVLIVATLTGIYCISLGVRRTNMMGCLLIPTIIWYLF